MTTKHTPTPWRTNSKNARRIFERKGLIVANCVLPDFGNASGKTSETAAANAAFIVRACNAHSDLVAALESVLPLADAWADGKAGSHPDHELIEVARALLAQLDADNA